MNQGVLLLNSSLTVETGKAGSHTHLNWNSFISSILFKFKQSPNIVYMLWGSEAAKHSKFIDNKNNLVLIGTHPGHYTAKKFITQRHFIKTNIFLKKIKSLEIKW
ncbi:UNG [Hepatospora eriocheir]|uniref:UNG n=1 Tax=Hepatospora eriocheir TaxID=1081669 RepID=A0A1X0QI58_9MICR|nr:UNG [Hepatospora eriocheir]